MPPTTARFLLVISLSLLPLQSAKAFFCFKFFMGGNSGNHPPRRLPYSARRYRTPPPSWFLSQPRYAPYPAYTQIPDEQPPQYPQVPASTITPSESSM
ncbi:hypothetical protein [Thiolapillus sp.]|uniref:hypothetical protein n=1 Tax=Thiolapillus sp. TaxID=2017437 RepID=UPI003AF4E412